jgi:hypothetical protein
VEWTALRRNEEGEKKKTKESVFKLKFLDLEE